MAPVYPHAMSEMDLTDEVEPTEQMVELQKQAEERAQRAHTDREEHDGEVSTDDFSVSDAIEGL